MLLNKSSLIPKLILLNCLLEAFTFRSVICPGVVCVRSKVLHNFCHCCMTTLGIKPGTVCIQVTLFWILFCFLPLTPIPLSYYSIFKSCSYLVEKALLLGFLPVPWLLLSLSRSLYSAVSFSFSTPQEETYWNFDWDYIQSDHLGNLASLQKNECVLKFSELEALLHVLH